MKTSASQLELLDGCGRKWWFRYIAKLPERRTPKADASVLFGSVLHGCCERFLDGEEVFPDGWETLKGQRITPKDAQLIRVLISKAIEAGYLEQRPGQEVEKETLLNAIPGVQVIVKKDFCTKDRVEDHKTGTNPKYFLGPQRLRKSIQMMIYAKDLIEEANKRGELLDVITLCHNQYLRDYEFPEVRRKEVDVHRSQVEAFWNETILPLIKKQVEYEKVTNPFDIPDPPSSACQDYGGCSRLPLCTGQETMEQYRRRMQLLSTKPMSDSTPPPTKAKDWLEQRARMGPAASATPAINPPPPAVAAAPAPVPQASNAPRVRPPWSHPECGLCRDSKNPGFTSKGIVCRICMGMSGKTAEGYQWATQEDGTIVWSSVGSPLPVATVAPPQVADGGSKKVYGINDITPQLKQCKTLAEVGGVISEARKVLVGNDLDLFLAAAEQFASELTEPVPTPEPAAAPEPEAPFTPPPEPPKRKPGRPRKSEAQAAADKEAKPKTSSGGFTLLIGAVIVKTDLVVDVIYAEDFLRNLDGYYDNDNVFQRRDAIRKHAADPEFLAELDGKTIVQRGHDADVENLISSLFPFATHIVQAVSR